MNLRARLEEETFDLDVHRTGEGTYRVRLGETRFDVSLSEPQPGVYSVLVGNGSFEVVLREVDEALDVAIAGRSYRVHVEDPATISRAEHAGTSSVVRSVMAGKVIDVLVAEGDEIEAGKPLLIIEAMKMENEIRSPRDGTVRSISVQSGQAVETGAELLVVE